MKVHSRQFPFQAAPLAGLGSAISGFGNTLARREEKIARMRAKAGLHDLQKQGQEIIDEHYQNIDVAGQGFLDRVQTDFIEKRDAYDVGLPPELKEEFGVRSDEVTDNVRTNAAVIERDQGIKFANSLLDQTLDGLVTAISENPDQFEKHMKAGLEAIDEAGALLPKQEVELRKVQWENEAAEAEATFDETPELDDEESDDEILPPLPKGLEGIPNLKAADVQSAAAKFIQRLLSKGNVKKRELAVQAQLYRYWFERLTQESVNE